MDEAKKIILDFYNAVDSESFDAGGQSETDRSNITVQTIDDNDKENYIKIGRTQISVDKIIQNLLVFDEWTTTREIVLLPDEIATREDGTPAAQIEEDIFSSHSQLKSPILDSERGIIGIQNQGKLHFSFRAELTESFI